MRKLFYVDITRQAFIMLSSCENKVKITRKQQLCHVEIKKNIGYIEITKRQKKNKKNKYAWP